MKVMIADDEKWVRTMIKTIIPFEKLGMTLVCEASNGIEALELFRQYNPDIMLTDIMMPGLTGLDLIKEIRNFSSNIKIAVISGYSDFEYAKTAMKYGITDYLLKPVDENELFQVLEKFKKERYEETRQMEAKEQQNEQYKVALPIICEVFLNQIISSNNLTSEKIKSDLAKYNISFKHQSYSISVVTPDNVQPETRESMGYYYCIIKRAMKRYLGAVTFPHANSSLGVVSIINHRDEINLEAFEKAFRLCSLIIQKKCNVTLSAGLSTSTHQPGMLQQLYIQAHKAIESRFWGGPGKVFRFNQTNFIEEFPLQLTEEALNKITLNLKLSNIQTALSYVDSAYSALMQSNNVKPELVREFFWQLVQSVISMLNIQLPFLHHELLVTGEQPYERLKKTVFIEQLVENTKDILQRIYDFFHDKNPVNNVNLVENAKRIIESNYAGDISLEQVAKHVHLSPAYLSELFKKETSMSFIDYKTIVRIENAKRLLKTSASNVYDISSKVGYTDPKYFSKLFKRITGKTVYEFRKEAKNV
jgi:two-component system, response regulator YesN